MRCNSILLNSMSEWNLLPVIFNNLVSIDLFKKTVVIHFFGQVQCLISLYLFLIIYYNSNCNDMI